VFVREQRTSSSGRTGMKGGGGRHGVKRVIGPGGEGIWEGRWGEGRGQVPKLEGVGGGAGGE